MCITIVIILINLVNSKVRMSHFYDDIILGVDHMVYARGEVYRHLANLPNNSQVPTDYELIYEVNEQPIPYLNEILWVNSNTYVGVTTDGNLFSFRSGNTVNFSSPIISAYVSDSQNNQLVVLLENGRPRIIHVDEDGSLMSVNSPDIDRAIPYDIVQLSPIHSMITPNSNEQYYLDYSPNFLMITSNNEILMINARYQQNDLRVDPNVDFIPFFDPLKAYLVLVTEIGNNVRLEHRDIIMIRSGWILMNDSRIYTIEQAPEGNHRLKEYDHRISDVML